jgi:dihydrodipicolinate synthase/N-acetylneuraminate lyase
LTRAQWLQRLFPAGVPRLWCPPLTHYAQDGALDRPRISAHLRHLSGHVKGLLVPGSTGDGWQMSPGQVREVLTVALEEAERLGLHVLIGALKPDAQDALATIRDTSAWLASRTPPEPATQDRLQVHAPRTTHAEAAPVTPPVCGFTVCAPRGSKRSQAEINRGLSLILEAGFPTALYQLPQVTQNEISPELAGDLAARFENFLLFKDSSGADRIALSGNPLGGVFTMRGGEGDYARWLKLVGGPYDGFLLGSANCFAAQLDQIIQYLSARKLDAASELSARLTAAVAATAKLVAGVPSGNAFANANKALDHFFAYGPRAASTPPPRLYGGACLPAEVIRAAGEILAHYRLMPAQGYLE